MKQWLISCHDPIISVAPLLSIEARPVNYYLNTILYCPSFHSYPFRLNNTAIYVFVRWLVQMILTDTNI
jgi:hypothetical protein